MRCAAGWMSRGAPPGTRARPASARHAGWVRGSACGHWGQPLEGQDEIGLRVGRAARSPVAPELCRRQQAHQARAVGPHPAGYQTTVWYLRRWHMQEGLSRC